VSEGGAAGPLPLQTIALVTPNLNTATFLRQTMESVLRQDYPALEYVVVDGGSTDGSLDIIDSYRPRLHAVIVEPDDGHADALNKGFARTTGTIMGWINSDDLLHQNALVTVEAIFALFPEVDWITGMPTTADGDRPPRIQKLHGRPFSYGDFLAGDFKWLQQESTFWRRSLWESSGGWLDTSLKLAVDLELWMRFFRHARLHTIEAFIGSFRVRAGQRSAVMLDEYLREAAWVISRERAALDAGEIVAPPASRKRNVTAHMSRRLRARVHLPQRFDVPRHQVQQALIERWVARI